MIYKASDEFQKELLNQPETGMGYQIFEAVPNSYSSFKENYIAYNSDIVIKIDILLAESKESLKLMSYSERKNISNIIHNYTFDSIKVLSKRELLQNIDFVNEAMPTYKSMSEKDNEVWESRYGDKGAIENEEEKADGEEIFIRLSHYENDNRIDTKNKCLKSESYTTTEKDYNCLTKNNLDPIDRYALPNNDEINWVFFIRPKIGDTLQRGTVQPANDKNGCGEEVYFEKGTSNGSYIGEKEH